MRAVARTLASIATLLAAHSTANAFTAAGVGTQTCGEWTAARNGEVTDGKLDEQWLIGFLTGAAWVGSIAGLPELDPIGTVGALAVWGWMDNYCRANPLVLQQEAAVAFIKVHPH